MVDSKFLRKVDGKNVKMALIQDLKLLLDCLFMVSEDLRWSACYVRQRFDAKYLSVESKYKDIAPLHEDELDV